MVWDCYLLVVGLLVGLICSRLLGRSAKAERAAARRERASNSRALRRLERGLAELNEKLGKKDLDKEKKRERKLKLKLKEKVKGKGTRTRQKLAGDSVASAPTMHTSAASSGIGDASDLDVTDASATDLSEEATEVPQPPKPVDHRRCLHFCDIQPDEIDLVRELAAEIKKPLGVSEKEFQMVMEEHSLLRFLRARAGDVSKATAMMTAYLKWVSDFQPFSVAPSSIKKVIDLGICHYYYKTRTTRQPLLVMYAARHPYKDRSIRDCLRYGVYVVEAGFARIGPLDRLSAVVDMSGFSASHLDYGLAREMLHLLQNFYPERLGSVYLLNYPWLMGAVWKVIKQAIDPKTAAKVKMISSSDDLEAEDIDLAHFPLALGGTCTLEVAKSDIGLHTLEEKLRLPADVAMATRSPRLRASQ